MKKFFLFILSFLLFISFGYCEEQTKSISKQDWEEYQQYKKEQANKVIVSDEEYEQYQQYLKEKENNNKEQQDNSNILNNESKEENQNTKKEINENELIIKFGKILNSSTKIKIKNTYYGTSASNTTSNSDGWDIKADFFHYLLTNTAIGCGVAYQTNFESNESDFIDIDVLVKQRFPLKFRANTSLYLICGVGYGYIYGKTKEYLDDNYYLNIAGGIHWRFSFGIDFTPFIIELTYTYNDIDYSTNIPNINCDGSHSIYILSVGYKFSL